MITCNNKAPEGWHCTRLVGHEGPCAAVPLSSESAKLVTAADLREIACCDNARLAKVAGAEMNSFCDPSFVYVAFTVDFRNGYPKFKKQYNEGERKLAEWRKANPTKRAFLQFRTNASFHEVSLCGPLLPVMLEKAVPGELPMTLPNPEWVPAPIPQQSHADTDADLIKLRWTLKTLIETVSHVRNQPLRSEEQYEHITLALRHLEDAESRLSRVLNL